MLLRFKIKTKISLRVDGYRVKNTILEKLLICENLGIETQKNDCPA